MLKRYIPFNDAVNLLGGDAEALAQAFEHKEAPLFLYARLRGFPAQTTGDAKWTSESAVGGYKLSGGWLDDSAFASTVEARIERVVGPFDNRDVGTRLTGYFIVHPHCIRNALLPQAEALHAKSYVLPPRAVSLVEYRHDDMPEFWIGVFPDWAREGYFDGYFLASAEIDSVIASTGGGGGARLAGEKSHGSEVTCIDGVAPPDSPQAKKRMRSVLSVVAALAEMAGVNVRGAQSGLDAKLQTMFDDPPKEDTVRDILKQARALTAAESPAKKT